MGAFQESQLTRVSRGCTACGKWVGCTLGSPDLVSLVLSGTINADRGCKLSSPVSEPGADKVGLQAVSSADV